MIDYFVGQYYFLSNFFEAPVTYEGRTYRNNEAAFQAAKCPGRESEFQFLDPSTAKRKGRRVQLRSDWEVVKFQIMKDIVRAKFTQNKELADMLLDTGTEELQEGNTWGDRIWGVCTGTGQNRLGKILMEVRDEIRQDRRQV